MAPHKRKTVCISMEREEIDTLPKLEIVKDLSSLDRREQFQIACEIITDVALTSSGCFEEMTEEAKLFDKELSRLCDNAKNALNLVISHIVCRVR